MSEENAPTSSLQTYQTPAGWLTSEKVLEGWVWVQSLSKWVWMYGEEREQILVQGAGNPEVNGVYTYHEEDGSYRMEGTEYYFKWTDKAGGILGLCKGGDTRWMYNAFVPEETAPYEVADWLTERGQRPDPIVTKI